MLVLSRKTQEQILVGENIRITVVRIQGGTVRIGIDAPGDVRILRGEVHKKEQAEAEGPPAAAHLGLRQQVARLRPADEGLPLALHRDVQAAHAV